MIIGRHRSSSSSFQTDETESTKSIVESKKLFTRLWSKTLSILSLDDSLGLPDSVLNDIENVSYIDIINEKIAQDFYKRFILSNDENYQLAFWNITLLKQLLVNLSIRLIRSAEIYKQKHAFINFRKAEEVNINVGLLCKETEQIKFPITKELKVLSDLLEESNFNADDVRLITSLRSLIDAIWHADKDSDIDIQVFYVDQFYDALEETYEVLNMSLEQHWITPYTWLYGDKDGRPFEKNSDTENLIKTLRNRIIERYKENLNSIFDEEKSYIYDNINGILEKLRSTPIGYNSPEELIIDLQALKDNCKNTLLVEVLIMKVRTFGFFYMEIEFRDNEKMLSSVVNEIIPHYLITKTFPDKKRYSDLNEDERIEILSYFISENQENTPDKLKEYYLSHTNNDYENKKEKYKEKDYITLMDIDGDYIKMHDTRNVLNRFSLMAKYPDMMKTHGIAEVGYISSIFELLFLSKTEKNLKNINIAIQPEDSQGALNTLDKIKKLYSNKLYRNHLSSLNDTQFITFGPSDTGKQGGKGMHKLNMSLAREHALIAKNYGIKLVRHVIVGGEHARCNGNFKEIFNEYGANNDEETRFMLAGCAEMRTHLLSKRQAVNFFSEVYTMHVGEKNKEHFTELKIAQKTWKKVVDRYQSNFFNSPSISGFLKNIARFDIVRGTAKGTRPPSRIYNIIEFESRPDAIRAIPWTRSILLSGLHSELIGAGVFATLPDYEIVQKYQTDIDFRNYIKHIAYAAARTDDELMWQTSGWSRPNNDTIVKLATIYEENDKSSTFNQLCWISHEIILAKDLVWRAIHGNSHLTPEYLSAKELLAPWRMLYEEVSWKERSLTPYKLVLIITKQDKSFISSKAFPNFYSGFLESANTDYSMIYAN